MADGIIWEDELPQSSEQPKSQGVIWEDELTPTKRSRVLSDPGGNTLMYGYEQSLGRRYGDLTQRAMETAGPENPPPGSAEWQDMNPGKTPTMGEVYDWNAQWVLPVSRSLKQGGGKGTTAMGPAQIVNLTREDFGRRKAEKLFGTKDWRSVPHTFENEHKLARAIYEEQTAGAWQATEQYEGFKDLSAFKGKDFEEIAPLLYRIDGGVLPDNYQDRIAQLKDTLSGSDLLELEKLSSQYETEQDAAEKMLTRAKRSTRAGEAAIQAFQQLSQTSKELGKLVDRFPGNEVRDSSPVLTAEQQEGEEEAFWAEQRAAVQKQSRKRASRSDREKAQEAALLADVKKARETLMAEKTVKNPNLRNLLNIEL